MVQGTVRSLRLRTGIVRVSSCTFLTFWGLGTDMATCILCPDQGWLTRGDRISDTIGQTSWKIGKVPLFS